MKKTAFLAACVLFILVVFIQGLNCSSTRDSRMGKEGPGYRPVLEAEIRYHHESNSEETNRENKLPVNTADTVLICKSKKAYAYHSRVCQGLKRCKAGTASMKKREAEKAGYRACKFCY